MADLGRCEGRLTEDPRRARHGEVGLLLSEHVSIRISDLVSIIPSAPSYSKYNPSHARKMLNAHPTKLSIAIQKSGVLVPDQY